jgi:hypothetical protein
MALPEHHILLKEASSQRQEKKRKNLTHHRLLILNLESIKMPQGHIVIERLKGEKGIMNMQKYIQSTRLTHQSTK